MMDKCKTCTTQQKKTTEAMNQINFSDINNKVSLYLIKLLVNGWEENRLDLVSANSLCAVDVTIRYMKVRLKSKSNSSRPFILTFPHRVFLCLQNAFVLVVY